MTNSWVKESMADFHAAFLGAGIADMGTYRPQIGDAVPDCRVFVDLDSVTASLAGVEIRAGQAMLRLLFDERISSAPRNGDVIEVNGRLFVISSRVRTDESSWVYVCQA